MTHYIILFEESRQIPGTYYTLHFSKNLYGNQLSPAQERKNLTEQVKDMESNGYTRKDSFPTATAEELFLNDLGLVTGMFFNEAGYYVKTVRLERHTLKAKLGD